MYSKENPRQGTSSHYQISYLDLSFWYCICQLNQYIYKYCDGNAVQRIPAFKIFLSFWDCYKWAAFGASPMKIVGSSVLRDDNSTMCGSMVVCAQGGNFERTEGAPSCAPAPAYRYNTAERRVVLQSRNIVHRSSAQASLCALNTGGGSSIVYYLQLCWPLVSRLLKVVPKLTPGWLQVFSQAERAESTSPICLCAVTS